MKKNEKRPSCGRSLVAFLQSSQSEAAADKQREVPAVTQSCPAAGHSGFLTDLEGAGAGSHLDQEKTATMQERV